MSVFEGPGAGSREGPGVFVLAMGAPLGVLLGRTPEAARSRMSTVVLPVVDDVAAAEGGGGVIVAIFVPGLSGGSPVVDPDGSFGVLGGSSEHPGGPVGRS